MFTHQGIAVDAWARIESNCRMEHKVVGDEMEIEFGARAGALNLVIRMKRLANWPPCLPTPKPHSAHWMPKRSGKDLRQHEVMSRGRSRASTFRHSVSAA